jgi:hypothetical protein
LLLGYLWMRRRAPEPPPKPVPTPTASPVTPTGQPNLQLPAQAEVRPVYPSVLTGPPEPLAQKLCAAVHEVPAQQRAACCKEPPGTVLTADCVRVFTYALRSKAVVLDESAVQQCTTAMSEAVKDCAWVGIFPPPLPAACTQAIQGTVPAQGRCRSSLECAQSLRCQGAGPTEPGTCAPPLPAGQRCATGVDTLAAYTRQDQLDRMRPECRGYCDRGHVCQESLPLQGECVMSVQCGQGNRCGGGKCVAGAIGQLGAPCVGGDCAGGLRCYKLRCMQPAAAGVACETDFDCLGGCLKKDPTHKTGVCGPRCF